MHKLGINFEHVVASANESNTSIFETLKKLKLYGISSVDILSSRIFCDASPVKKDLLLSGVSADCVFFMGDFGHDENIGYALSVVDFCAENGVKQIMLLTKEFATNDDLVKYDALLKRNLRRIVKYAKNFNVKVAIENFGGEFSAFSTVERVLNLVKSIKDLGVIFDSGNFLQAGEDPLNAVKVLMPYLHRVHLKDRTYTEVIGSPMKPSIDGKNTYTTTLGEGDSKIKEIISEVNKNYDNIDFVLEFDFEKLNVTENILNSATYYFTEIN